MHSSRFTCVTQERVNKIRANYVPWWKYALPIGYLGVGGPRVSSTGYKPIAPYLCFVGDAALYWCFLGVGTN